MTRIYAPNEVAICESCDFGYNPAATNCTWCGCSNQMSYIAMRKIEIFDIELYRNYLLLGFTSCEFNMFPNSAPLDVTAIQRLLSRSTIYTFNGNGYDVPILTLAMSGADNATLKQASDAIIQQNLRSWQFYDTYNLTQLKWIDHVDLIEVSPGQASLKAYGGKMHSHTIQDLPIPHDAMIEWPQRLILREYNKNDLQTTDDLRNTLSEQLKLRDAMSLQYGMDLRSKSDAQIAEAIFKKSIPFEVQRPNIPVGTVLRYTPPACIGFSTPLLQNALQVVTAAEFIIGANGSPMLPQCIADLDICIGSTKYTLQIGGLHSCEESLSHRADDAALLRDVDVASYYPNMIRNFNLSPDQIGEIFNTIYSGWIDTRIEAKRAKRKADADSLKTLVNGTFGKTGSIWSILYAPKLMLTVTLSGQLLLLMLIEQLELNGIPVVSANTDGVVSKCPRRLEGLMAQICKWWEGVTNLELESADYASLHSRDVNSYIAIKTDGSVKLKGAYAPPLIIGPSWPNPTYQICTTAATAYLQHGTPLHETVLACTDMRQFVETRAVKGGGEWVRRIGPPVESTKRDMRTVLLAQGWKHIPATRKPVVAESWIDSDGVLHTLEAAYASLITETDVVYLGKVARWYIAKDDADATSEVRTVAKGHRVAGSQNCRPMMTLTDNVPDDLDYDWYIETAQDILEEIGVFK